MIPRVFFSLVLWVVLSFVASEAAQSQPLLTVDQRWQVDSNSSQQPTEEAADLPFEITVAFDYGGDIYTTDFQSDPVSITNTETYEIIPAWSPNGSQIAFLSSPSYETGEKSVLQVLTVATGEVQQLSELAFTSESTLTWSPDGRYIAVTLGTIFIVDVDAQEDWRLPVDCGPCSVNWLPDSSGLIFAMKGEIFRIDVDGGNLQQITHAPPNIYRPRLSPVSGEVVFQSTAEDVSGLYSLNLDNLEINRLVALSGYDIFAHEWSPDGEHIAFDVFQGYNSDVDIPGGSDVYVLNKDGTNMRTVSGDGYDSVIGWSNDSQYVIYYEKEPGGARGSYFGVNIANETQIRLSGDMIEDMCSYSNCRNFAIRPSR